MKMAYSINGEGFGHASRMVALVPGLLRWHDLELFVPSSVADFVGKALPDVTMHHIPTFSFSKRRDKIIYSRTIWQNVPLALNGLARIFRLSRQLRRQKFDAVVSDFDPFLAWAGRLAGLPVLQINHPGILLKFPSLELQHLAASIVAMMMEGPWTKRIHCSFFRGDVGPILRPELRQHPISQGEFILVNLKSGYREQVMACLNQLKTDQPWLQWQFFPNPKADFPAALASCRAVISAAGHQMVSEALALGKPVLAIPQEGQGEQQLNARMLVKSGRGMSCRLQDLSLHLPDFLARLPKFENAFKQPAPRRFNLKDSTDDTVLRITRLLLPRRERRQTIHHLNLQDLGLPPEFRLNSLAIDHFSNDESTATPSLNVTVIGSGYVGLLASAGLADWGHYCIGVDLDVNKIDQLSHGFPPIYEPGLEAILQRNLAAGRLRYTTALEPAMVNADVIMICVGTPPDTSGAADLSALMTVGDAIAIQLSQRAAANSEVRRPSPVIVIKSTVPVGTNRLLRQRIALAGQLRPGIDFEVASNPEFLREGRAVEDFFNPERTVVGTENPWARLVLERLYQPLTQKSSPLVFCEPESAELAKYAANAFLATKIGFINQIANLSEACGANAATVASIMGMDSRIGAKFLQPGPGYGGSCFPKDTLALRQIAKQYHVDLDIVDASIKANIKQSDRMLKKLLALARLDSLEELAGRRIAILGLSFKPQTDDIRESPAIRMVSRLVEAGAQLQLHDPQAMDHFAQLFPASRIIRYEKSAEQALAKADMAVIMTEWDEYRRLPLSSFTSLMSSALVLDTRNIIDLSEANAIGLRLELVGKQGNARDQIGAKAIKPRRIRTTKKIKY